MIFVIGLGTVTNMRWAEQHVSLCWFHHHQEMILGGIEGGILMVILHR